MSWREEDRQGLAAIVGGIVILALVGHQWDKHKKDDEQLRERVAAAEETAIEASRRVDGLESDVSDLQSRVDDLEQRLGVQ